MQLFFPYLLILSKLIASDESIRMLLLDKMLIKGKRFELARALTADEWLSGKGVRLSILDFVLDTSSIPSSANKFNVSGLR